MCLKTEIFSGGDFTKNKIYSHTALLVNQTNLKENKYGLLGVLVTPPDSQLKMILGRIYPSNPGREGVETFFNDCISNHLGVRSATADGEKCNPRTLMRGTILIYAVDHAAKRCVRSVLLSLATIFSEQGIFYA